MVRDHEKFDEQLLPLEEGEVVRERSEGGEDRSEAGSTVDRLGGGFVGGGLDGFGRGSGEPDAKAVDEDEGEELGRVRVGGADEGDSGGADLVRRTLGDEVKESLSETGAEETGRSEWKKDGKGGVEKDAPNRLIRSNLLLVTLPYGLECVGKPDPILGSRSLAVDLVVKEKIRLGTLKAELRKRRVLEESICVRRGQL